MDITQPIDLTGDALNLRTVNTDEHELAGANICPDETIDSDDAPILALIGRPLHDLSQSELLDHLRTLQEYIAQPAKRQLDAKDAQTKIVTGARPKRTVLNIKSLL